ncbi:MAG: hypothetical protein P4N60_01185 [Verrucomicrobiae bacterium]|nr:hypothetical protein [Verrucomicrobiae bacterium]
MIPVKVVCGCGQKYSFDVEPVNGRMPSRVACPVCGVDGTAAANEILARSQAVPPPPPRPAPTLTAAPVPAPVPVSTARLQTAAAPPPAPVAPLAPAAPPPPSTAETGIQRLTRELKAHTGEPEEDKWKWWYYILAGICIGGYSIWQSYTQNRIKPLGELFLAVFCIAIGVWDFQRKRKKQQ